MLLSHASRPNRRRESLGPRAVPGSTRGFTLLELLVVIAIIGLLVAYVGPRYFSQIGKSERGVAKAQVEAFSRALDAFRLDVGRYPTTEEGLAVLVNRPGVVQTWNGPYLQKAPPADPWGRPYAYRSPGSKAEFEVTTLGKDGQPGGGGDSADISSSE
jgi:general secretion pathway protein G